MQSISNSFAFIYSILALRYLFVAGIAFLIFYLLRPGNFLRLRIQKTFPKKKDYYREIGYSFLSFIFFALIGLAMFKTPLKGYLKVYSHVSDYGVAYLIASIFLAILIHDTYFYWTHRLMHHPKLFKAFHLTHHKSTNPSPWAAFAFNPLEAIVEASVIVIIALIIPIHHYAIMAFLFISTVVNVYGHLGYEIYPAWLIRSKAGKWLNTSVSHNMHHKYFKGNYSFYTRFWDIAMGTMHPDYEANLDKVLNKDANSELIIPA